MSRQRDDYSWIQQSLQHSIMAAQSNKRLWAEEEALQQQKGSSRTPAKDELGCVHRSPVQSIQTAG